MKLLFTLTLGLLSFLSYAQTETDLVSEIKTYQTDANEEFGNPETTILTPKDFIGFKELEFFPIDLKYRIVAKYIRTPDEKPFKMPTTTN